MHCCRGWPSSRPNSNNQHLNTYISFADKLKNWWDFSGKLILMTIIPCSPPSKPNETAKASQTTMIVEVQCDPGSAHYIWWVDIAFVLLQYLLPTRAQRKKTLLQQSKISCSSKTRTVNHFPRKKVNSLLGKEEEEHWTIIFWVLTLGCKIHFPSFHLPSPPLRSLVISVSALSSLSPDPAPHALCVLVLLRATADDAHLKRENEKKARTENQATGRQVLGSHDESAACRRFVWMCF